MYSLVEYPKAFICGGMMVFTVAVRGMAPGQATAFPAEAPATAHNKNTITYKK